MSHVRFRNCHCSLCLCLHVTRLLGRVECLLSCFYNGGCNLFLRLHMSHVRFRNCHCSLCLRSSSFRLVDVGLVQFRPDVRDCLFVTGNKHLRDSYFRNRLFNGGNHGLCFFDQQLPLYLSYSHLALSQHNLCLSLSGFLHHLGLDLLLLLQRLRCGHNVSTLSSDHQCCLRRLH